MANIDRNRNKNFTFENMKTICLTVVGAMLATSLIAQDNTNSLPAIPTPAASPAAESTPAPTPEATPAPETVPAMTDTNAPAAAPKKRHVVHRRKIHEPTVTLVPGPATVAADHVNVRGQAGLNGEVIAHQFKGDTVIVLDQIDLKKHASDEPAQWAKIVYPTNADVWVFAKYIDTNNLVSTKKLNLRAGPGENFSTVGVLNNGDSVNPVETKGRWMKIEPPTNSYAFVAAMFLTQTSSAPESVAMNTPAPTPTEVEPTPTPVMTPQTEVNTPPPVPAPENTPAPVPTTPETMPQVTYDNNLPRIVSHEGVVRHVSSLITPTAYELYAPATDVNIDFLYTTSTNLDLGKYIGMQIIVTGEEDLAAHWQIPVLTIQQIIVVNTNAVPNTIYYSPRSQQERGRH
jgi:uncharacterized protein YgiM (DUF1202 family)